MIALTSDVLLPLPKEHLVAECRSVTDALVKCQNASGLLDKQIIEAGIVTDAGTWSRIKNPGIKAHYFPQEKLIDYMRLCGNLLPLAYLADSMGYMLRAKETELKRQVRERDELIAELAMKIRSQNELIVDLAAKQGATKSR